MTLTKILDVLSDLTYAFFTSVFVGFCYLPMMRPDFPWWSRLMAFAAGTTIVWLARTTPRRCE